MFKFCMSKYSLGQSSRPNFDLCDGMQLSLKGLVCDILRMICHIYFKCGTINLRKQRKFPAKYQHLTIALLNGASERDGSYCIVVVLFINLFILVQLPMPVTRLVYLLPEILIHRLEALKEVSKPTLVQLDFNLYFQVAF